MGTKHGSIQQWRRWFICWRTFDLPFADGRRNVPAWARIGLSKRPSVEIAAEREPWQIDRARGLGGDESAKLVNAGLQGSKLDPQRANLARQPVGSDAIERALSATE
jgi:hypothetical protein